jgi:phosphatidate cytidylyltransferase
MLVQRVISALVGIPIIAALILIGGVPYVAVAAGILALGVLEYYAATDPETSATSPTHPRLRRAAPSMFRQRMPALAGCAAVVAMAVTAYEGLDELTAAFAVAVALVFLLMIVRGDVQTGFRDWLWVVGGLAYVGFLGAHLVLLRDLDNGRDWVFVGVFGTFIADTAAYFVGRAVGSHPIAPAVSPGKTVEGGIAGLVAGAIAVFVIVWITGVDVDELELIPLALLLPAVAVVGDLGESLIKRGAGVKDTSELVPGHGGFLDRLDSILFTTPLVYYFVIWVVL